MNRAKRIVMCLITLLTLSCLIAGCNTIRGAGEDIEAGGEAIQDAAD